jgi:hypothetical protein
MIYDPAKFAEGSAVRIASLQVLQEFKKSWQIHNPLVLEQLAYANTIATVKRSFMYHGGDVLYQLADTPGLWHEVLLEQP